MERMPIKKIEVIKISDLSRIQDELTNCIAKQEKKHDFKFKQHFLFRKDNCYFIIVLFGNKKQKYHFGFNNGNYRTKILHDISLFKLADQINKQISDMIEERFVLIDLQVQKDINDEFVFSLVYEFCNFFVSN